MKDFGASKRQSPVLARTAAGTYALTTFGREALGTSPPEYVEALLRYLAVVDLAFTRAKARSEFWFILSILRVRGVRAAGWDSFENTLVAIPKIKAYVNEARSYIIQRNLQLWLYGHIMEASEPYELLGNLLRIGNGEGWNPSLFPDVKIGKKGQSRPQSAGEKIEKIAALAKNAGLETVSDLFREVWDRRLRNAIFHADYSLAANEVRIPVRAYKDPEIEGLLNRAMAYHNAVSSLYDWTIQSYTATTRVPVPKEFGEPPSALVIVREGWGLAGIRADLTRNQISSGGIPWMLAQLMEGEAASLNADPERGLLPRQVKVRDLAPMPERQ